MWAYRGGPVTSNDTTLAGRLHSRLTETPTLATMETIAEEHGINIDLSDRTFPHLDRIFEKPEDREEAKAKSWVNRKK